MNIMNNIEYYGTWSVLLIFFHRYLSSDIRNGFFFLYDWLHGINVKSGLHTSLHTNRKPCNILPWSASSRFSTLFPFSSRCGERGQISRKMIPSDIVIARKSNPVKETNRGIHSIIPITSLCPICQLVNAIEISLIFTKNIFDKLNKEVVNK